MNRALWVMGFSALLLVGAAAAPAPSTRPADANHPTPAARELALKDIEGVERRPLDCGEGKGAVVFFISHDCPISNSYAPEIKRIASAYGGAGKFTFSIVHPYAELTVDEARKHAKEYALTLPIFIDKQHVVCDRVGAKVTPEVAVVAPDGKVLYLGRIDDKWADYGKSRVEPTVRDLRDALDAILAGKPVKSPQTEAVGCPI